MSRWSGVLTILGFALVFAFRFWGTEIVGWFMGPAPEPVAIQRVPVKLRPLDRSHLRPLVPTPPSAPQGRLVFAYEQTDDPDDYSAFTYAVNAPLFQGLSDEVFNYLPLAADLPVVVGRCGMENAVWVPDARVIVLCTELVDHFYEVFADADPAVTKASVDGALLFTLTHELGHATEDLLGLKLTGNGENNADQFATVFLLGLGSPGVQAVAAAADWFRVDGQPELRGQIAFWDEHGLNLERYADLLCWLYGSEPARYGFVVGGFLPETRAARCPGEYARFREGWRAQLDGKLKRPLP